MSTRVCVFAVPAAVACDDLVERVGVAMSDVRPPKDLFVRFADDQLVERTGLRFFTVETSASFGQYACEVVYETMIQAFHDLAFVVHDDARGRSCFEWRIGVPDVVLRSDGPMLSGPSFLLEIDYPQKPFSNEALARLHQRELRTLSEAEAAAVQDWWSAPRIGFAQWVPALGVNEYLAPMRSPICWRVGEKGPGRAPDGLASIFDARAPNEWFEACAPRLDLSAEQLAARDAAATRHFYWRFLGASASAAHLAKNLTALLRMIELGGEIGWMYAAELYRERGAGWLALRCYRDSARAGTVREWTAVGEILLEQGFARRALDAFEWCDHTRLLERPYQAAQERARQLAAHEAPRPHHLRWQDTQVTSDAGRAAAAALRDADPFDQARGVIALLTSDDSADGVALALAALDTWAFHQLVDAPWPPRPAAATPTIDREAVSHHDRGVELRDRGELDEALQAFRRCLELDVANEDAYMNASSVLIAMDRAQEAANLLARGIAMLPDCADLYYNRACAHALRRDQPAMLADLERCFTLAPASVADARGDADLESYRDDPEVVALFARFELSART